MNRLLHLVLVYPLLIGCVADVTPQGSMVRQINMKDIDACKFLGVVEGSESFGWSIAEDRRSALNKVRNITASKGGNAFVLNDAITTALNTSIQAEAYLC